MPLTILVPMILVGLPLVIGLVWWMNQNKPAAKLDEAGMAQRFLLDFPNVSPGKTWISDDGNEALILTGNPHEIAFVHRVGQKFLTRLVSRDNLTRVAEMPDGIDLQFNDFTLRQVRFYVENESLKSEVMTALQKVKG